MYNLPGTRIFSFSLSCPGDYVIIVRDVTSPPFLDAVLQPAYVHVKVISKQKRAKSKDRK